jgi:hypothetical protein
MRIHQNCISLCTLRINFYAGHFGIVKRFIFPDGDPRLAKTIERATLVALRITNRDTSLTELRQRFTTHLLQRFRTGTPLLEKFVNNESSCVSTTARRRRPVISTARMGRDKINFGVYVSVFRCRSRYGRFCNDR